MGYPDSLNIDPSLNGTSIDMSGFSVTSGLDDLAGVAAFMGGPIAMSFDDHNLPNGPEQPSGLASSGIDDYGVMIHPSWPKGLPNLSTLRHL